MFVPWKPGDNAAYSYLFGWYLGDGRVSDSAYQLVITCDSAYPAIIDECCRALEAAVPGRRAHVRPHKVDNSVRIESGWVHWPDALP